MVFRQKVPQKWQTPRFSCSLNGLYEKRGSERVWGQSSAEVSIFYLKIIRDRPKMMGLGAGCGDEGGRTFPKRKTRGQRFFRGPPSAFVGASTFFDGPLWVLSKKCWPQQIIDLRRAQKVYFQKARSMNMKNEGSAISGEPFVEKLWRNPISWNFDDVIRLMTSLQHLSGTR